MVHLGTNKFQRVFLAGAVIFFVFITVVFLTRTNKKLPLEQALNNIEDKQFRACISEYAKKNQIEFTHKMSRLECKPNPDSQGEVLYIKSLAGISQLKYLTYLDLSNTELKSLDEVGYLKNLEYLSLKNSKIVMIGDLISLDKLRYLSLANNNIINVSVLAHLINIEYLDLENNYIANTSFLEPLVNLKELNLKSNSLTSTEHFQNLSKIEILNLSDNYINNIDALRFCRGIKNLDLSDNKIADLSPLAELSNLEEINLNNNRIEDLTAVSDLLPKKLLLQDNFIREGTSKLFSTVTTVDAKLNFKALIDLRLNRTIGCDDLYKLRNRLFSYHQITIRGPVSCIHAQRFKHRSKKRRNSLWHRFLHVF